MLNIKNEYKKNGYFVINKLISKDQIIELKKTIANLQPKLMVPFSDEAWGYGNCVELDSFKLITENNKILEALYQILSDSIEFNHLMINRKPPWIGPEVEYHQEVFNSKTFAPGASVDVVAKNWCQIYIPLDSETPSNGGLRIISNSHLLGQLNSEDFINQNFSHKRRVPVDVLNKIVKSENIKLIDLNLEAGDCLLFSPFLIHGSPSNGTSEDRVSIVLQSKVKNFEPDSSVFEDEASYRSSFITKSLKTKISEIDKNNLYADFK